MAGSNGLKKTHFRQRRLTEQQSAFARLLAATNDRVLAYREVYKPPPDATDQRCRLNAHRIARLPHVAARIDTLMCRRMRAIAMTADDVIQRFQRIYHEAMDRGDLKAATKAMSEAAKLAGLYVKHNRQRAGTDTAEQIRERLKARGLDVDTLFPKSPQPSAN